jgi:hypothetical protein
LVLVIQLTQKDQMIPEEVSQGLKSVGEEKIQGSKKWKAGD